MTGHLLGAAGGIEGFSPSWQFIATPCPQRLITALPIPTAIWTMCLTNQDKRKSNMRFQTVSALAAQTRRCYLRGTKNSSLDVECFERAPLCFVLCSL